MIGRSHPPGFSVDLGPRADADPLAREIRRRIVANLEQGGRLATFRRMWGTVVVVAVSEDRGGTPTHTTLTLRFDWGRLMIHEGRVGRPDVTLWGPPEAILALGAWGRLPRWPAGPSSSSGTPGSNSIEDAVPKASDGAPRDGALARTPVTSALGKLRYGWIRLSEALPPSRFVTGARPGLRVYGARRHPRFVWRLARLLA